jgi:hypothetical protein
LYSRTTAKDLPIQEPDAKKIDRGKSIAKERSGSVLDAASSGGPWVGRASGKQKPQKLDTIQYGTF